MNHGLLHGKGEFLWHDDNHRAFFGNLQADNRVINTDWNFQEEFSWKGMSQTMLNLLTPALGIGYL